MPTVTPGVRIRGGRTLLVTAYLPTVAFAARRSALAQLFIQAFRDEGAQPVRPPDPSARFTDIYRRHHRQVHAYAVSRAGRQLADDIVSETFLVAWRRLAAVLADPLPWLLGVARNVTHERYRVEVRQTSLATEMRAWIDEAGLDIAEGVAERAATLAALAGLNDADREILTLTAWHGLSTGDSAKVLGCSRATFFVRLHRARKRFEQALSAQDAVTPAHQSDQRRVTDESCVATAR
ncbi:RNA polymerase sigma factor [Allorhizocola rhizosphaerae]|uniref:RNA polymerase sigma factor n=1 Tax=Allorhizocola rhizosphaerae TaxID=1872709 RepID=UPI000E3DD550|nr:RNA polymerase sigma factor [Allorhizocola rhizosphaerae]